MNEIMKIGLGLDIDTDGGLIDDEELDACRNPLYCHNSWWGGIPEKSHRLKPDDYTEAIVGIKALN